MRQKIKNKNHLSLIIWIVALIAIGGVIGSLTKPEISSWYSTLNRSTLTPPNYVFPVAWTLLYGLIGTCGWMIWGAQPFRGQSTLKILYGVQMVLNWSWTPLFFKYHCTGLSLGVLISMDIVVSLFMYFSYPKLRTVSLLMMPYLGWILFATYLNFYIWDHS